MYKSQGNFVQPASQCSIPKTQDKNYHDTYTSNWIKIKFLNVKIISIKTELLIARRNQKDQTREKNKGSFLDLFNTRSPRFCPKYINKN